MKTPFPIDSNFSFNSSATRFAISQGLVSGNSLFQRIRWAGNARRSYQAGKLDSQRRSIAPAAKRTLVRQSRAPERIEEVESARLCLTLCGDGQLFPANASMKHFGQSLALAMLTAALQTSALSQLDPLTQPANTWVKRTPLPATPVSPRLGYEGACVWDSKHRVVIRYGGHNQGGGGEQGSEIWTFDPLTAQWALKEPNLSPPGVCCNAQCVRPIARALHSFPSFSGSLAGNGGARFISTMCLPGRTTWQRTPGAIGVRFRRRMSRLRQRRGTATQVVVVFGGEGGPRETLTYDPHRRVAMDEASPNLNRSVVNGLRRRTQAARDVRLAVTDDPHTWLYDLRKRWRDAQPATMPPGQERRGADLPARFVGRAGHRKNNDRPDDAAQQWLKRGPDAGANQWTKLNPRAEPDPSGVARGN
jgi:hypothetical protein